MKRIIIISGALFFAIGMSVYYLLLITKPMCEPCAEGVYCPPCVNEYQKLIITGGVIVILFIIFRMVYLIRKQEHEHNQPT